MLGNSSFSQTGATPISGINNFLNKQFGVPLPKAPAPAPMQGPTIMNSSNASMVPQGNSNGLLPGVNSSSQQKKTTVDAAGNTTTVHAATPNPSVLAQQQSLNKLGAGLVEDGIAGPKTSAAIAKYANAGQTSTPASPTSTPKSPVATPPPTPTPPPPLTVAGQAGGVTQAGMLNSTEQSGLNDPGVAKANDALTQFKIDTAKKLGAISNEPIPLEFQQGRQQVVSNIAAAELGALETGVQNAITARGQTLGAGQAQGNRALGGAESVLGAVAPQFPSFGSQVVQPGLLGGANAGGGSGLPQNAVDFINSLAQQVKSGMMTRADAESRIAQYSQPGLQALDSALGPNFNTNASNASAATTATGQQVGTFATSANAALDKLTADFASLPDWQKLGIPGTIGMEQALGKFFGNDKLATYQTTLHDARAQLSGVLATAGGMTPTSAEDTAKTYLPDNMTHDQLTAKITAAKALVAQKVSAFQNSGAQNGTSGGSAGGGFAEVW